MDLATLSLFMDVAQRRSFAEVARVRGLDPSAVSRAVAALEHRLGAVLVRRTTRSMVLTEAGESLMERLPELIAGFEQLRDEVADARKHPVGVVRVTASQAFGQVCLVPLLRDFLALYPGLQLDLVLTDDTLNLVADRIDLAFRMGPAHRADVTGERLMTTRYRVVASPDWLSTNGAPETPGALADRPCLLLALPQFRSRWIFRRHGEERIVSVRGQVMMSSVLALREAARAGLGPALLADWLIADDVAAGRLVDVFPDDEVTATTFDTGVWMLHGAGAYLPRKVRLARDHVRAVFRQGAHAGPVR